MANSERFRVKEAGPGFPVQLAWTTSPAEPRSEPGRPSAALDADTVFDALDNRALRLLGRNWQVHVYSVSDQGGGRWVQLGLESTDHRLMSTVCVDPTDSPEHILMAAQSWLVSHYQHAAASNVA
jgi:hypothetical protein